MDDNVIKTFQGYYSPVAKRFVHSVCILLTLGAVCIVSWWSNRAAIRLQLAACPLCQATKIYITLNSGKTALVSVAAQQHIVARRHLGCLPSKVCTAPPLLHLRHNNVQYYYSQTARNFVKVPNVPGDFHQQLHSALHELAAIERGAGWSRFNSASVWSRRQRQKMFGENDLHIVQPTLLQLLLFDLLQPWHVALAAESIMMIVVLRKYVLPSALLIILFIRIIHISRQRNDQARRLTLSSRWPQLVPYVCGCFVRAMPAQRLVPGDVIVVQPGIAVCDAVLLRGACLCEQSTLSGEVIQTRKMAYRPGDYPGQIYNPDTHRLCLVGAGSTVQQVWNENDEQEEVLAMVAQTGERTIMGRMMQSLRDEQQPSARFTVGGFDTKDFYRLIVGLAAVNSIHILVLIPWMIKHAYAARAILKQLFILQLYSMQPLYLAALFVQRGIIQARLRRQGLHVHDQRKMLHAAHMDVLIFDKTGTLTIDHGHLHGIAVAEDSKMAGFRADPIAWGNDLKKHIALCHDLVQLPKNKIAGQQDDRRAFAAVEAVFTGPSSVSLPLQQKGSGSRRRSGELVEMHILRRLKHDSGRLASCVIAARGDESDYEVFIRGNAITITQLCEPSSLPPNWGQAPIDWGGKGFRVLGLAHGRVRPESRHLLEELSLDNLKQHMCDTKLLGFSVITNALRSDTKAAIAELQERGRIRTMIATGDHFANVIAIAHTLGVLAEKAHHVLIYALPPPPSPQLQSSTRSQASSRAPSRASSRPASRIPSRPPSRSASRSSTRSPPRAPSIVLPHKVQPVLVHSLKPRGSVLLSSLQPDGDMLQRPARQQSVHFAQDKNVPQDGDAGTLHAHKPSSQPTKQQPQTVMHTTRQHIGHKHGGGSSQTAFLPEHAQQAGTSPTDASQTQMARRWPGKLQPLAAREGHAGPERVVSMQQAAQEEHAVVEQLVAVQTASLEEQSCSKKVVSIQSPAQDVQLSTGRAVSLQQPAQEEQACGVGGAIPLQQAPQQTGQAVARAQVSARGCTATEDTKTETASASTVAKTPMPTPDVPNREHRTASQASTAGGQQSARGDTATMRAKPDEAPVAPASDVQARVQHTSSQAGRIAMQSLVFVCAQGDKLERQSLEEGLRLLAEGYKGIITGPVLDILVQHAAPAVLDLVLRSTAVCAQMRSEHKKQLVELMSSQGATLPGKQHIKGQALVVGYMGDGINDVAALHVADVGIGVGPQEAIVAAPFRSLSVSATVACKLIKEARGGHDVIYALFAFVAVFDYLYIMIDAILVMTGNISQLTWEFNIINCAAALVCLSFLCTTSQQLRGWGTVPPKKLLTAQTLLPLLLLAMLLPVQQGLAQFALHRQTWYSSGVDPVPAAATALIVGAFQTLSPMLATLPTSLEHLQQKLISIALAVVCHGALIGLALYPVGDVLLAKYLPLSFKAPLIAVTAASMVLNVLCTKVRVQTLRFGAVQPAWVP